MKLQMNWSLLGRAFVMTLILTVLAGCASTTPAPVRQSTAQPGGNAPPTGSKVVEHVVQPGDTLIGIARLYGQSATDLAVWNDLINPDQIVPGQRLRVSQPDGMAGQGVGPVAIVRPVEINPIAPPGEEAGSAGAVPLKQTPKGGKQPYSDQAWAALQSGTSASPGAIETLPPVATPEDRDSRWLWPASGTVIAGFNGTSNKGLDISGKPGDPVIASAAGKVVYSGSGLRGFGKLVIVKHDENYLTAYAHNQELLVKEGDSVGKGQKIAELGSTDADRPKLHFEIRKQGRPVDPLTYLPPR